MFPISVGMVPVKVDLVMDKEAIDSKRPISVGMVPVISFASIHKATVGTGKEEVMLENLKQQSTCTHNPSDFYLHKSVICPVFKNSKSNFMALRLMYK